MDLHAAFAEFEAKNATEAAPEKPAEPVVEAAAEKVPAATEAPAAEAASEQPRDEKGKFIPLNRHEDVLNKARSETATERTAREAAEQRATALDAELKKAQAELEASKNAAATVQTDEEFEKQLAESAEFLPESTLNLLRSQHAALKAERSERVKLNEKLVAEQQAAAEQIQQASFRADLAKVPELQKVYDNPRLKPTIDAISDDLMAREGYAFTTREAHFKAVLTEFHKEVGTPARPLPSELPKAPAAPASLAALSSGQPPAVPGTAVEGMSFFETLQAATKLTPAQRENMILRSGG